MPFFAFLSLSPSFINILYNYFFYALGSTIEERDRVEQDSENTSENTWSDFNFVFFSSKFENFLKFSSTIERSLSKLLFNLIKILANQTKPKNSLSIMCYQYTKDAFH